MRRGPEAVRGAPHRHVNPAATLVVLLGDRAEADDAKPLQ